MATLDGQTEPNSQGQATGPSSVAGLATQPGKLRVKVSDRQIEALRKCIAETLKSYQRKRRHNKIGAILVHTLTIGFSTSTTVLVGWSFANGATGKEILQNPALLLSALATATSSLEAVFDYRALWVGYNVSISRIKAVLARLQYLESLGAENLTQEEIEDLYTEYANVCASMEKDYKDIRKDDN